MKGGPQHLVEKVDLEALDLLGLVDILNATGSQ